MVQLAHPLHGRQVALVKEPELMLLRDVSSIYELALAALDEGVGIKEFARSRLSGEILDYTSVYEGDSLWNLLPSFDHSVDPLGCIVSGTGLTHKASAVNRQNMHRTGKDKLTDSMQMYQWGLDGGRPQPGKVGVQPEWFYKGNGTALRAHRQPLEVPPYGNDGGEEPEVAAVYIIDGRGQPLRIGFSTGNEFSDHVMEKKNYLYLAPSKLRDCSIGPELVIGGDFQSVEGRVEILRNGLPAWSENIKTGEKNMVHTLENMEYHHFKYPGHRVPFQAHVHFFGADAFSFGSQVPLEDGDIMSVQWNGFGRALQNPLKIAKEKESLVKVRSLG